MPLLWLLQVEEKVVAELESHELLATADQPEPRVPEYHDLAGLTYLACVVKETMRIHTVCCTQSCRHSCLWCTRL